MARPIQPLSLTADQRRELRSIVNRPKASVRDVRRAWIILNRTDGLSQQQTAARNHLNRCVVAQWEKRFRQHGLAGFGAPPRGGAEKGLTTPPPTPRASPHPPP